MAESTLFNIVPVGQPVETTKEQVNLVATTKAKKKSKIRLCQKDLLAIVGTAGTMSATPFKDKNFEIWAVQVCRSYEEFKRADLYFEMHTEGYWQNEEVLKRMRSIKEPIYMHKKYKEVPTSMKYPIEVITEKYRRYHVTSISYMLALAYHSYLETEKPKHVALFGIHMEAREEYTEQRPCCEYWLGVMEGAGMDIEVAPGGAILVSSGLYGYENYDPICYDYRKRLEELRGGFQKANMEVQKWSNQRAKQEGAIAESELWLRKFQRGEYK